MKMEKGKITMLFLLGFVFLSSCKKEEEVLTDQESSDLIEASISEQDAGAMSDYKIAADIAMTEYAVYEFNCSYTGDTTYSTVLSTGIRTYSMSSTLTWNVNCSGGTVNAITFDLTNTGTYTGPRLSREGTTTASLTLTNLSSTSSTLTGNGNINYTGSADYEGKKTSKTVETTLAMTLSDLVINKTTYEIEGGTASITITASSGGNSITKTASITFAGGGSATITINGNSYTISIYG